MPIGVTLLPSRHLDPDSLVRLARLAEDLGYDSLWIPETWGYDAVALLAVLARATTSIRLAAGVLPIYSRSAALIAQAAATLQDLSHGRFILGLGSSGPIVVEQWHGVPFRAPVVRMREYIEAIRLALGGERVDVGGQILNLSGFRLTIHARPVPIALAALGPRNIRLAGEVADMWLPIFACRGHMAPLFACLDAGLTAAGRARESITVAAFIPGLVSPRATRLLQQQLAYYVGGMGTFYAAYLTRLGFGTAVGLIRDPWARGDRAAAVTAVDPILVDLCTLGHSAATATERLEAYRREGIDLPIVSIPNGATADEAGATLRALAALL